jgi:hypothetical protein
MKKIIKGKRYDTDTAKKVGEDHYLYPGDFNYWKEALYRKMTGEFFLYGEGGEASKYRERTYDGMWCSGEKITPMTLQEAQEWAEGHLSGDEYEDIFGEVDESGEKSQISMWLDKALVERLKRLSSDKGISASDFVAGLIRNYRE